MPITIMQYSPISLPFKYIPSTELQPGSVPGPGGLFDRYVCEICGVYYDHQVYGYLSEREGNDLRIYLKGWLLSHSRTHPVAVKPEGEVE